MKLRILFSFLLGLVVCASFGQNNVKIVAKKGDGINGILRKYKIIQSECNKVHFYVLNKLKPKDYLKRGKKYELPIFVYRYNGKSIRSTIGLNSYEQAKKIQLYNEAMHKAKIVKKDFRKSRVLWVPYNLLVCPGEGVEVSKGSKGRVFPIFGEKHAKVPLKSTKLKGKVYYIVSGHGGPDPGAVNRERGRKICEDEYAYDISLRLAKNLIAHGAIAYMVIRDANDGIRDGSKLKADKDEVCWKNLAIPLNQKRRLYQRSTTINKLYDYYKYKGYKEQYSIMIHIDSRRHKRRIDIFYYHFPGSRLGKKLAKRLQTTVRKKYQQVNKNRGYGGTVKARDLHMLREVSTPSVYIELGNLKNNQDLERFLKTNNRQAIANWLYEGLAGFKP